MATSPDAVAEALLRDGLHAFVVSPAGTPKSRVRSSSPAHAAVALGTLAELLDAGLPPLRALQLLRGTAPASWKGALDDICAAVEQGASVSVALAEAPLALPPVIPGLIAAGESGMGLAAGVRQAASVMEQRAALRRALSSTLAYPAVLLVTGVAAVSLLVMVVLPRFAIILRSMHVALPLSTRVVLAIGDFTGAYGTYVMVSLAVAVGATLLWVRTPAGSLSSGEIVLGLPIIGRLRHGLVTAQCVSALGALLDSGVPMTQALGYAANVSGNAAMTRRFLDAAELVRRGESISSAFATTHATPDTVVRLARAGEETGRLAAMLANAARLEQQDADFRLRALVGLVEPVLILSFGAAVAFVAAALFQAMYAIRPGT